MQTTFSVQIGTAMLGSLSKKHLSKAQMSWPLESSLINASWLEKLDYKSISFNLLNVTKSDISSIVTANMISWYTGMCSQAFR